ncbi:MAG TPA: metal ABC transporter permease [Thermomicrobiales bacterium]|nr:metal ABC transporter permease [Thermomicrobiales bacterium]
MNAGTTIMIVGALVGASCGLIGAYLVLRRLALLGDAISHSVLLGIVVVFWLTHSRSPLLMTIGAGAVGLLTVALVAWIQRTGLVKEDAAIGLVFPFLFALGVFMISRFPSTVHIDVDAVLYGEIAYTPLYRLEMFGFDLGTQAFWTMGAMLAVNLALVVLLYKELKLTTFDAGFAAAIGISPVVIHYLLMAAVSATTVVAFDAVGAILVVAMLIVPAATAQLLTRRLPILLGLSMAIGVVAAIGGYWLARWIDGSIAGSIATVLGIGFGLAWLFSPSQGLLARLLLRQRQRQVFLRELVVAHIAGKPGGVDPVSLDEDFGWASGTTQRAVRDALSRRQLATAPDGTLTATETTP